MIDEEKLRAKLAKLLKKPAYPTPSADSPFYGIYPFDSFNSAPLINAIVKTVKECEEEGSGE